MVPQPFRQWRASVECVVALLAACAACASALAQPGAPYGASRDNTVPGGTLASGTLSDPPAPPPPTAAAGPYTTRGDPSLMGRAVSAPEVLAPRQAPPTPPVPLVSPPIPPPPPPAPRAPLPPAPPAQPAKGLPAGAPTLVISGGTYSADPAKRAVIVNGQVFREGADLGSGVVLQQIKPDGVMLGYRGSHYPVRY